MRDCRLRCGVVGEATRNKKLGSQAAGCEVADFTQGWQAVV